MTLLVACLLAGRLHNTGINPVYTKGAGLDTSLAAGRIHRLISQCLMHEGACLVGTRHHTVATTDTTVTVDKHDTINPFE